MTIRYQHNSAGMVEVLLSDGVKEDLERRAEAIRVAAEAEGHMVNGRPGKDPLPYVVRVEKHGDRNVAQVVAKHPAGRAVEAKYRVLGRNIDAAR